MKVLVKGRTTRGLWLEEVPEPEPGINDCQSSSSTHWDFVELTSTSTNGDQWTKSTISVPLILGHEFVGEMSQLDRM